VRLEYEVVQFVDGHLFDAESYELTSGKMVLTQAEAGYYAVLRTRHDHATRKFLGPFASAQHAASAIRDLQLPSGAIECGADGSLAAAAAPCEKEEVS
jgi:hypothetical protein